MLVCQLVERDGQLLFDGKPLRDGDWLEVLVWDGLSHEAYWAVTRLYKSNEGWLGLGCLRYQLNGLFARL